MENFKILARKAAAIAPAMLLMMGAAPGQRVNAGPGVTHKSPPPAMRTASSVTMQNAAQFDTQENRQLGADLAGTFNTSLANVYLPQGPDTALQLAPTPWTNSDVMTMMANVPDRQLFVAAITMVELPDFGRDFVTGLVDEDRNGKSWGGGYGETDQQYRQDHAADIYKEAKWDAQLALLGGPTKKDGIVEINPGSLWQKDVITGAGYCASHQRTGESQYNALIRLRTVPGFFGPRMCSVVDAIQKQHLSQSAKLKNNPSTALVAKGPTPGGQ